MKKLYCILAALTLTLSAAAQTDIISATPEGTHLKNLYGQRDGYYNYYWSSFRGQTDGTIEEIVVAQDGTLYLKNPASYYLTDTWIKGTPAGGDTISFQFPQTVYTETVSGKVYNYAIWRMVKQDRTWTVDTETQTVKFLWKDGKLQKTEQESMLGLCTEDGATWTNYGDLGITVSSLDEQPVAPARPDEARSYLLTYTDDNATETKRVVRVAIEDNDFFLGGFATNQPGAWTKGTVAADGSVTFSGRTYLGPDTVNTVHTWFIPTTDGSDELASLTLTLDATTGTYTAAEGFIVNTGRGDLSAYETFTGLTLEPYVATEGQPAKPVFEGVMLYGDYGDYGGIRFTLPTQTVDGDYLDPSRMFYRIYFDGEALTLDPSEYVYLDEPMTDIPYTYDDGYDIRVSGELHTFYFYRSDLETIGVASFYRGDSMTWPSTMVYLNLKNIDAGIDAFDADREGATTTFTDLTGRRIEKPSHGLYLKTVRQADGTTTTRKVVVK